MKKYFFLVILLFPFSFLFSQTTGNSPANKTVLSADINQLDTTLLKKRLEKAHGELGKGQKSTWEVGFDGQIYKWDWNGGWNCSAGKEIVDCGNWKPMSLIWFETKTSWLKPWTTIVKEEFVLDEEKKIPTSNTVPSEVEVSEPAIDAVETGGKTAEPVRLGGQRLALQAWKWSSADKEVKVYTSLRTDWVERIDHDGIVEYLEWKRNPKTKSLTLNQLIMEKDGQRLSARRVEPVKSATPKKN